MPFGLEMMAAEVPVAQEAVSEALERGTAATLKLAVPQMHLVC